MKIITLKIQGMTCDDCARTIAKYFANKNGIVDNQIDYNTGLGNFTYDETKISKENIIKIINSSAHYKVTSEISSNKEKNKHFDLIIIGGGSAAFSAAIKAESMGLTTLMVNAGLDLGGTCVNVGCIPSKIIIRAAEAAHFASNSNFTGIIPKGVDIDFQKIIIHEKKLVATLQKQKYLDVVSDYKYLTIIKGWAKFKNPNTIIVDDKYQYSAIKFIIATGASTNIPNIDGLSQTGYLTNRTLFNLEKKPESITILGAGYIGCEIAMAYNRLGVKITMIEFTNRILSSQMPDISHTLKQQMEKEGIKILPGYRAIKFVKSRNENIIFCKKPDGSIIRIKEPGKIVIATGIKANTQKLNISKIGLKLAARGHIKVNHKMETNLPHIFAAGDVADTPSYVYTAAHEGNIAVENAFTGSNKIINYSALPWVVFTDPQVAGCGLDEAQAETLHIPYEVSKLEMKNVPRAIAANDTRGFIKLIRNNKTDKLIGARVIAPEGGELIQLLSMSIKYGITIGELAENIYPYLTLNESIKLAAITFDKDVSKLSCCAI